mmetsp:Transcript_61334/g.99299  ORF Transcript_61334/g.99299 Transcript_61334/m.99299 type:complete len:314 (-) Transcript_61334:213-1154(-)
MSGLYHPKLNLKGYPLVPGKNCSFYMKSKECRFGSYCKFNHPECVRERSCDLSHYEAFRQHNKDRMDVSFFLCHFTKSEHPVNSNNIHQIQGFAHERFNAILTQKKVYDCVLPHLDAPVRAVCFTEMMLPSLSMHAEKYSPWGVAFHKSFLFNETRANQVLYCRDELFQSMKEKAKGDHDLLRYMTPFAPKYSEHLQGANPIDYSHEREWRTPGPVSFELENLAYVFVPDIRVFKELMPDLHTQLCKEGVEIRVIEKVVKDGSCNRSYRCTFGLKCDFKHTKDEKDIFCVRERPNLEGGAASSASRLADATTR